MSAPNPLADDQRDDSDDRALVGGTSAMLLCLDREQRLVYVFGEIFTRPWLTSTLVMCPSAQGGSGLA